MSFELPYDSSVFGDLVANLKMTIGSAINIGFIILGICISIGLIARIFSWIMSFPFGFRNVSHGSLGRGSGLSVPSVERAPLSFSPSRRYSTMKTQYDERMHYRQLHYQRDHKE